MTTTQNSHSTFLAAELSAAGTKHHNGTSTNRVVASLSAEAYEIATRVSEDTQGVGLTGLVEDVADGNVDVNIVTDVLFDAARKVVWG